MGDALFLRPSHGLAMRLGFFADRRQRAPQPAGNGGRRAEERESHGIRTHQPCGKLQVHARPDGATYVRRLRRAAGAPARAQTTAKCRREQHQYSG